jgi:RNA polymerase sigma-70 factor (ECF subfamily)
MRDAPAIETSSSEASASERRAPLRGASHEDLALVQRILARDETAFAELVDRHHASLLRVALAYASNPASAAEVVQDTWMGVLRGLAKFEGRSSLKTWIFHILVHRAKTKGVRDARSVPFSALEGGAQEGEPAVDPSRFKSDGMWARPPRNWDESTPEKLLLDREARRRIEDAIAALPAQQRVVISLRDLEGLEPADVCNILEISETNQRVLLHRARSKVRAELERYLAGDEVEC